MKREYHVVRMNVDGSVGCDYGWGSEDWMLNMVRDEIHFCIDGLEYVKVEKGDLEDDEDWDDVEDE